jgi:YesN/AraC family two-component response regulator
LLVRNFGLHAVYDGQQALEFIKHENPDVMIIDLRMPGMNGLEVLRQVKKINRNIEVIMLSGYGTMENERTSMELGAFAFLHKPADLEKLSETIKAAYNKIATEKRFD